MSLFSKERLGETGRFGEAPTGLFASIGTEVQSEYANLFGGDGQEWKREKDCGNTDRENSVKFQH